MRYAVSNVKNALRDITKNIRCLEAASDDKYVLFVVDVAAKLGLFAGVFALMETLPKEKYSAAIFERLIEHIGQAGSVARDNMDRESEESEIRI